MAERAYIVYGNDPVEDACVVFAGTAREAKRMGWPVVCGWTDCEWIDLRAKRLNGPCEHLRLRPGPHVNESPLVCERCELWPETPLRVVHSAHCSRTVVTTCDGVCEDCHDAEEAEWLEDAGG